MVDTNEYSQVSFQLVCSRCRAVHPIEVQNQWGAYPGTAGLGPQMVCPELIDNAKGTAKEVCRGALGLITT